VTTNLATGHRIIGRYLDLLPIDHADLRERSVDLWCESHPEAIPLAWAYAQEHDRPAVYATPGKSGDGWWTQVSWLENDVWVYVWADIEDPATIDRLTAVMVASRSDYARIVAAISGEAARTPEPAQTQQPRVFVASKNGYRYREDERGGVEAAPAYDPDNWGSTAWASLDDVRRELGPLTELPAETKEA
jgi:hypothetical protein